MISMIVLMISVMAMIIFMIIILWSFMFCSCYSSYPAAPAAPAPTAAAFYPLLPFWFFFRMVIFSVTMVVRRSLSCFLFDQIDYRYLNHDNLYVRCILSHDVHLFTFVFAALAPAAPATRHLQLLQRLCHVETFCFVDLCDFDYLDAHRYLLHDYDDDDLSSSNYHYHSLYHVFV